MKPNVNGLIKHFAAKDRNDMRANIESFDRMIVQGEPDRFPAAGTRRGIAEGSCIELQALRVSVTVKRTRLEKRRLGRDELKAFKC
ncbi:MAG: hypothetical protein ABL985_17210 [Casimicrobium sp.]